MPKKTTTKTKIPKELSNVTSLSKVTAAVLFIVLPFVFFYLGLEYGKAYTEPSQCMVVDK